MLAGCTPSDAGTRALTAQGSSAPSGSTSQPSSPGQPGATGQAIPGQPAPAPSIPSSTAPGETTSPTDATPTPDGDSSGAATPGQGDGTPSGNPSPSGTEEPPTTPQKPATQSPSAGKAQRAGKVNCAKTKCVALTFDDGPGPYTQRVLNDLTSANARATFFVVGTQVKAHPQLVKNSVAAGMEVGNHSWDHPNLERLSMAQVRREFSLVDEQIESLTGVRPTFVRPPEGALAKAQKQALGRPLAYWAVDTLDWKTRNTRTTIEAASKAKPGDIVLMHDIHGQTAAAVPQIIKNLQAKGYHLVTMSELIGAHPKNGIGYGWGKRP